MAKKQVKKKVNKKSENASMEAFSKDLAANVLEFKFVQDLKQISRLAVATGLDEDIPLKFCQNYINYRNGLKKNSKQNSKRT